MNLLRQLIPRALPAVLLVFVASALSAEVEAVKTLPENGAVSDKPVRSLRVWLNEEPDVEQCKLELEGPQGALTVTGLHTMGEKDLMARVAGAMPDGEYTAKWSVTDKDGKVREGTWTFTVKRGG